MNELDITIEELDQYLAGKPQDEPAFYAGESSCCPLARCGQSTKYQQLQVFGESYIDDFEDPTEMPLSKWQRAFVKGIDALIPKSLYIQVVEVTPRQARAVLQKVKGKAK